MSGYAYVIQKKGDVWLIDTEMKEQSLNSTHGAAQGMSYWAESLAYFQANLPLLYLRDKKKAKAFTQNNTEIPNKTKNKQYQSYWVPHM